MFFLTHRFPIGRYWCLGTAQKLKRQVLTSKRFLGKEHAEQNYYKEMRRVVFIVVAMLAVFPNAFTQKEIPLELYVKCCTGDVKPNMKEYSIGISVYKDSVHIGNSNLDYRVTLPDTGTYVLKTLEGNQEHVLHIDNYELVRDTFDIVYWEWYSKGNGICWMCGWCVIDGFIVSYDENGEIEQEDLFKNGKIYME